MKPSRIQAAPIDGRIVAYRCVRTVLLAVLIGLAVKVALFDSVLIRTSEMEPALLPGDRVLILRGACGPLGFHAGPRRNAPVVFVHPRNRAELGCLRVAALGGDSLQVRDGALEILKPPGFQVRPRTTTEPVLPADYSPRDQMSPLRVPRRGDTVFLSNLPQRDFFFAASMIAQERPKRTFRISANLLVDGSAMNGYWIQSFPLYKGSFDSIPDSLRTSWFFWDRLQHHLQASLDNRRVSIAFTLTEDGAPVIYHVFRTSYAFLLADNWVRGYDSRYFGPVCTANIRGTAVCILWSHGQDEKGKKGIRWGRLMRIVK